MFELVAAGASIQAGHAYFNNTPWLASHRGSQPDLYATWNIIPAHATAIDVVLYLHGFALSGARSAALADFVAVSGLAPGGAGNGLSGRTRPTLAIIPRGDASPTAPSHGGAWPYYFPAVGDDGAKALIDGVLDDFASARRALGIVGTAATCTTAKLIVMTHSGGGKGVKRILASRDTGPDELHFFDALYEDPDPPLRAWIDTCFAHPDADRRLSIHYTGQTRHFSEETAEYVRRRLARADSAIVLRERFRIAAAAVGHMDVPRHYAQTLLADRDTGAAAVAADAEAVVDHDPAVPLSEAEQSDIADLDTARMLANLGLQVAAPVDADSPQLAAAAATTIKLDIAAARSFLDACVNAKPRVGYGLGAKVPFRGAIPGKDFRRVDCSGFVREAIRRAEAEPLGFPDGSVVQHDWVRAHQFATDTVANAGAHDGVVRIAFLRPQDSPSRIGHVVLIHEGQTLESHGGKGPDSLPWTGGGWQKRAYVYRLTAAGS